jgi:transcriptional regulator with XRE-family HTH domain
VSFVRMMKGWTQADLASRVGVSRSAISMIESGDRTPRRATYERIVAAVGSSRKNLEAIGAVVASERTKGRR